jgi:hypothetical protein
MLGKFEQGGTEEIENFSPPLTLFPPVEFFGHSQVSTSLILSGVDAAANRLDRFSH